MKLPRKRKGAKKKPPALPPIPSGNEALDMLWRDTASTASDVFLTLPDDAADEWATPEGVGVFVRTLLRTGAARRELDRTAALSTLWSLRERVLQRELVLGFEQAGCIAAAIVRGIRHDYPKATAEQVWLVLHDRFGALAEAWVQSPEGIEPLALPGEASSS